MAEQPTPEQGPAPVITEMPKFDPPTPEAVEAARTHQFEDVEAYAARVEADQAAREQAEAARRQIIDAQPITVVDHTGERPHTTTTVGELPPQARENVYQMKKDSASSTAETPPTKTSRTGLRGLVDRLRGR